MENENKPVVVIGPTRKCKCCGQNLSLDKFKLCSGGVKRHTTCIDCEAKQEKAKSSERFINFTSRELIEELRYRGYKGELTYTKVEKVII